MTAREFLVGDPTGKFPIALRFTTAAGITRTIGLRSWPLTPLQQGVLETMIEDWERHDAERHQ